MLSQEQDHGVRSDADEDRDDQVAHVQVPEPRSPSAARLLEMTARDTDQWRSDARAEAAAIVAAAREEAGALVHSAQREAERTVEAARREAARTVDEARASADEVRAETERRRAQGEAEVAHLEQVAADHDQYLRRHLTAMLDRLDSRPGRTEAHRRDL